MAARNQFIHRGRGRGNSRWRGAGTDSVNRRVIEVSDETSGVRKPLLVRPTHFLALPLHNHPALRAKVAAFQAALFGDDVQGNTSAPRSSKNTVRTSSLVEGLDSSIIIDPVRMHMTLGVMALESEDNDVVNREGTSSRHPKTVSTALALLASLSPKISQILDGEEGVKIPLEVLDVFKTAKMPKSTTETGKEQKIGADVLFLGPREAVGNAMNDEKRKLMDVCALINGTFREVGYLTDIRPLKLHCTILNSSHRKPRRRFPFSYSDIRSNKTACDLLRSSQLTAASQDLENRNAAVVTSDHSRASLLPPMPVELGTWLVDEVQLWVMGSRDEEGRYVSCGGIKLGAQ